MIKKKNRVATTCMVVATAMSLCVAPANAIVGGDDIPQNDPFIKSVVQVDNLAPVEGDNTKKTFCTGTMINPPRNTTGMSKWVITAKHCLMRDGVKMVSPYPHRNVNDGRADMENMLTHGLSLIHI